MIIEQRSQRRTHSPNRCRRKGNAYQAPNGEIQRTIQNCITILQNDHVLADAIRLNLLSERIDIVKPVGWPRSGKTLNDTDMKYILRRMEKYGIFSEKKIESAIRIVANENRYHPSGII